MSYSSNVMNIWHDFLLTSDNNKLCIQPTIPMLKESYISM